MAVDGLNDIDRVKTWVGMRIAETAEWRRAKISEYPEDDRNRRSSEALEAAGSHVMQCEGAKSEGLMRLARYVAAARDSGLDLLAPEPASAPLPGFATKRVLRRYGFDNLSWLPDDASHETLLRELADATVDDLRERLFEVEGKSPLAEVVRAEPATGPVDPIVELTMEIRDLRHELSTAKLDAIAARIDEAATDVYTSHGLDGALKVTEEEAAGPLGAARLAFLYSEGHGERSGGFFTPFLEMTDGTAFPPRFENVPQGVSDLWQALADRVTVPIARARLHDLCFEGRWGHGGDHGQAAALAYLEMSAVDPYALDENGRLFAAVGKVDWLRRSLFLARVRKDNELAERAIAAIVDAARQSLAQEDLEPGVNLGHISTLVDDGAEIDELGELLAAARARYAGGDAHQIADTIELQLRHGRSDPGRVEQLRRELVETWIEHAKRHEGLIRMHFLEQAAQLAGNFNLKDLLGIATSELQKISIDDLGLVDHSVRVPIPAERIDEYMAEYTSADSWRTAMLLLIRAAPSGDPDANRQAAEKLAKDTPLVSLLPRTRVGGDGLPRYTPPNEEAQRELRLIDYEMSAAKLFGIFFAVALRRIWAKWGPIPVDELAQFLAERKHVRPPVAAAIARSFIRFFEGDAEGAVYTAVPKIETLTRELVVALDLPTYQTQRVTRPGQYPGLGALLPSLKDAIPESWWRYLNSYIASPLGDNVRNEVLHGFVDEFSETTAALVLIAALYLAAGLELTEQEETS